MRRQRQVLLLDANACNARQAIPELNELEALAKASRIDLLYTETTWEEAGVGSSRRRRKTDRYFFTGLATDAENKALQAGWRDKISIIVFPNGISDKNQERDIEALLTAKIAGIAFVTSDGASKTQPGGILGHADELATLGIEVLSFRQALVRALDA